MSDPRDSEPAANRTPAELEEIHRRISRMPGAQAVRAEIATETGQRFVRDQFRTERRLRTSLRAIELSEDPEERVLAADSLGSFGPRATAALGRALGEDAAWRVRQHAAVALGKTGDPAAVADLRSALDDSHPLVRDAAGEALDVVAILSKVSPPEILKPDDVRRRAESDAGRGEKEMAVIVDFEELKLASDLAGQGERALMLEDFPKALRLFEELIELSPGFEAGYTGRGRAYEGLGDVERALADYDRALEIDPESALAYKRRAICWRKMEDWDQALRDAEKAVELDEADPQTWYNLGVTRLHFDDDTGAAAAFERALELRPDYAQAHFNQGVLMMRGNDYAAAAEAFSRGLERDPDNALGLFNRAMAYWQLDESEKAEEDLRRAVELQPALAAHLTGHQKP